jgi:hypothetical protein
VPNGLVDGAPEDAIDRNQAGTVEWGWGTVPSTLVAGPTEGPGCEVEAVGVQSGVMHEGHDAGGKAITQGANLVAGKAAAGASAPGRQRVRLGGEAGAWGRGPTGQKSSRAVAGHSVAASSGIAASRWSAGPEDTVIGSQREPSKTDRTPGRKRAGVGIDSPRPNPYLVSRPEQRGEGLGGLARWLGRGRSQREGARWGRRGAGWAGNVAG